MKTLFLIRHAKSSWAHEGIEDRDRPLKGRGIRDAHLVAKALSDGMDQQTRIKFYSSPATRALHTALIFAQNFQLPAAQITLKDALYDCFAHELLEVIKASEDLADTVFYFAHNPAITDFVNKMTAANIANVPTTGVVSIAFDVKYWREIDTNGKLVQFEYPKRLKK